eukprot:scaffold6986_cov190-Amphora_coffeaeformis.AAC.1
MVHKNESGMAACVPRSTDSQCDFRKDAKFGHAIVVLVPIRDKLSPLCRPILFHSVLQRVEYLLVMGIGGAVETGRIFQVQVRSTPVETSLERAGENRRTTTRQLEVDVDAGYWFFSSATVLVAANKTKFASLVPCEESMVAIGPRLFRVLGIRSSGSFSFTFSIKRCGNVALAVFTSCVQKGGFGSLSDTSRPDKSEYNPKRPMRVYKIIMAWWKQ